MAQAGQQQDPTHRVLLAAAAWFWGALVYGAHAHACAQSFWDLLIARASRCNFLWFPREERADNAVQVCPLVAVIPSVLSDADKGQPPP